LPGTVKRSNPTRSPAARKRAATRWCALRSAVDAAGRGPALASDAAKVCASAAEGCGGGVAAAPVVAGDVAAALAVAGGVAAALVVAGGVAAAPVVVATLTAAMRAGITR
jgi:hypothetical protein